MGKASRQKAERRKAGITGPSSAVEQRKAKAAAQRFSPGALAVDESELEDLLKMMPADRLPYLGLSMYYLASSPVRDANQCLLASTVLMIALHSFGVRADLVALEVAIPSAGVSYGSATPRFENDALVGHVGLLAGDTFIDATAAQFDEIRDVRGVAPVVGIMPDPSALRSQGGRLPFPLGANATFDYTVYPVGSADRVGVEFARMQPENEVARQVTNLVRGFTWVVSQLRGNITTGLPKLDELIAAATLAASQGKTPEIADGVMQYR
jgi:hypothetical protein